jgi:hypothetical protein
MLDPAVRSAPLWLLSIVALLRVGSIIGAASLVPSLAPAQWLNVPQAAIPRTADGQPDVRAPTPSLPDGTPDLGASGDPPTTSSFVTWRRT